MAQRYIYLPDELNLKLKEEENASALIVRLLNKYYEIENKESPGEIEKKIETLKRKQEEFIKSISADVGQLTTKKVLVEKQIETVEETQAKNEKKENDKKDYVRKTFIEFMKREITEEELNEYFNRLLNEGGFNMFKFLEEKGYKYPEAENAK